VRLILNADDFGASDEVNAAVAAGFARGLISRASAMANGAAFAGAAALARKLGVSDRVGIHLNATEGHSLTAPIRDWPRLCGPDGRLRYRRNRHLWLAAGEQEALRQEWAAQIAACRAAGLGLGHADSHHHLHAEWPVFRLLAPLLREHGISRLRLSDNVRPTGLARRCYKLAFNAALRRRGLQGADYFCTLEGVARLRPEGDAVAEVMLHPQLDRAGAVIDADSGIALADWLGALPPGWRVDGVQAA
jgi:predicted glycoside hydrolase/deacetylase ChbG (UPF0249 family)